MRLQVKTLVFKFLSIRIVAELLERPTWYWLRLSEKSALLATKMHRNLPRVKALATSRGETRVQVATKYYRELAEIVAQLAQQPKISVLLPIYKVAPHFLREALESVEAQVYPHWELCIVDDASGDPVLTAIMQEFAERHGAKIKIRVHAANTHISGASNTCLELATGDYVALLDHDDRLYPNALAEMVRYINFVGAPDILYSDECTVDATGSHLTAVYRKPAWSPLMHLAMNYTTHLSVYRRSLVDQVGGFRRGFEGAQDHDLMLRLTEATTKPPVHVPFNLYQWRAHPASTANARDAKPYAASAGEKAVGEALIRRGRAGSVSFDPHTLHYRVRFQLQEPTTKVSIIIPSKDVASLLSRCLGSIRERTSYRDYEVLIADNGSVEAETQQVYDQFRREWGERFTVVREERPFNFGAQVDSAVRASSGGYLLLLNNDTEVITSEWIEELLSLAQFPDIGAVGCKLLLENGRIQHGGIVLNASNIAEHAGFLCREDDNLYWNVLNTAHETSAVSAACLMVARAKYAAAGGLDKQLLSRGYGDVAFCLKLRDLGLTNVYTPHAVLKHAEQQSRGRSIEYFERFALLQRRGQDLAYDPYFNPRLTPGTQFRANPFYDDLDLCGEDFTAVVRARTEAGKRS